MTPVYEARVHDVTSVVLALSERGLHPRVADVESVAFPWVALGGLAAVSVLVPDPEATEARAVIAGLGGDSRGARTDVGPRRRLGMPTLGAAMRLVIAAEFAVAIVLVVLELAGAFE